MGGYRSPGSDPGSDVAVIGRRSAVSQWTAIVTHTGLIAGIVALIVVWQWPIWLAAIGVVLLVSLSQDLYALSIPVEFALTGTGMHIRHGQRTAMPWMRPVRHFIPWSEVHGVRTHELRVNGISSTTLHIETASGTVSIEPGTFDAPAEHLQTRILDHMHSLGGAAEREQARVDDFCRARWVTPLRLVARRNVGALVGMFVLLVLPLAALAYAAATMWPLWLGISALYIFGIGSALLAQRRVRVLELRADGFGLGSAPDRLVVIPWRDILLVRRQIDTSSGARLTTALDLRLRDGRSITLDGAYGRPLDELAELLDPPLAKLALARAAIAAGVDIETATRTAGLPARTKTVTH